MNRYLAAFFKHYPEYAECVADTGGLGLCAEFTVDLVALFPELRRVPGYVRLANPDPGEKFEWTHWWCVAPDGSIVDPTRAQFGPGDLTYHTIDLGSPPTGRCLHCGGLSFNHRYTCSDACAFEAAKQSTLEFLC